MVGVALAGLIVSSAVVIPSSVPRVAAGPPACADADGDWLCDTAELPYGDTDGDSLPNWNDADDDGDTIATRSEHADPNDDGDPRDARDRDRDAQPDWLDAPTRATSSPVVGEQRISDIAGGLAAPLANGDEFSSVASAGDIDRDGIVDLIVGALGDDDGGPGRGAAYVLFLNADGTVRAEQKISSTSGGFGVGLDDNDGFGWSTEGLGDLDGDGVGDVAVGANKDDDGDSNRGAVWILFLNTDGTVKAKQKISDTTGGLAAVLGNDDEFGSEVAALGDVDGDGLGDIAVGAAKDDDGGTDHGAVYVLFLNGDGTVKSEQKISDDAGGFTSSLAAGDGFGYGVGGLGDIDADGIGDMVVGAWKSDLGGTDRGAAYVIRLNADGTVKGEQVLASSTGGVGVLDNGDLFGSGVAGVGDLDHDGIPDLLVGAGADDDGVGNAGAVYLFTLTSTGSADSQAKISLTSNGFTGPLSSGAAWGDRVTGLGDFDGDGAIDLAAGAWGQDDGGTDRGAVFVVRLTAVDLCGPDTDGDGLLDCHEDGDLDGDGDPTTNAGPDTDGDSLPNWNDADDDGDGLATSTERADPNSDGDPRDARDRDRDGQPDWLDAPTTATDAWVVDEQKISDTSGGFVGVLNGNDVFHVTTAIGDVDGDGTVDLAVGAPADDDGQANAGAVYVLFLNADGTVRAEQKISDTDGGLTTTLDAGDEFGFAVAGVGDLDGDSIGEIAVGVRSDDDGGSGRGAVFVLFLNADGTVRAEQKISDTTGGLVAPLSNGSEFGTGVAGIGDLDGDGLPDLAVGARLGDDGGLDRGEIHVLFLNANGAVRAEQKISDTAGGLAATLDDGANFGRGLAGPGDIDGDGVEDVVVGAPLGDGGGPDRGEVHVLFLNVNGTVRAEQEISSTTGGLVPVLRDGDRFGESIAGVGDLDGDGIVDLAIGAGGTDHGGIDRGAVHLVRLTSSGTVDARGTLSGTLGGVTGPLDDGDGFGGAVTGLGDLDGDGDLDLAVGAAGDDDGGTDRGAAYVLDLVAATDTDGDGLHDHREVTFGDTDGDSLPNWNDPDDDGDGLATASEHADPNGDGDPRDARDRDRDGQPDWLDGGTAPSATPIAQVQKISDTAGGLAAAFTDTDQFGAEVTAIGDLDGDGVVDLAVGANLDDGGGLDRGSVYVLFMNADGTVRDEQEINDLQGGLTATIDDGDYFGRSIAALGDVDGDGVVDLAVGAPFDDDGGADRGAVYVLFMNVDGTVRAEQKISDTQGGLVATLDYFDLFGLAAEGIGDLDGDGIPDLVVGARNDDDGGVDRGAVYVLFLNPDGTVRAEQKISDTQGGLTATLDNSDWFGVAVAGIGDLDGDGTTELVVGARNDDDGGPDTGAAYVLFMNVDGTVRAEQKISDTQGAPPTMLALDDGDWFGSALAGLGDLDADGRPDLAVGAWRNDDGGTDRGAVHVLFLNADGTVRSAPTLSDTQGGLSAALDDGDNFGGSVTGLGDLDGDGTIGLAVGAFLDDDGGTDRGAVYVLDLRSPPPAVVNSTGDAVDDAPGDGMCTTGATNSEGDPECTLRAAIQEANAHPVVAAIHFGVPVTDPGHASGVWTVAPTSPLPAITAPVVLDATTQPGWTVGPVVEIDGSSAGALVDGLTLAAGSGGSEIRGLAIGGFTQEGITIALGSDGNLIAGNHLGADASGTVDAGNASSGIYVESDDNTIGGTTAQDRNVISGNDGYGIYLGWSSDNTILGNRIGVDVTGNAPLGNTWNGIFVAGTDHIIGGAAPGAGNIVGDNGDIGVRIETGSGHRIIGNSIGVGADGSTAIGNVTGVSVRFGATDVVIGGTAPGTGNTIRNNGKGVLVQDAATDDIAVIGNVISSTGGLAIDIGDDGVTANDAGDTDTGPNGRLNFPVLTAGAHIAGTIDLDLQLDAPAGTYRIEVFANPSGADPSGHGEGEQFVHAFTAVHAGAGAQNFSTSFAGSSGAVLTATATENLGGGSFGSTSEFSAVFTVCADADGDGLCDHLEDLYGDTDGDLVVNRLDADDDGDGVPTASENADPNGDGDPRDARDLDRDGQPDWIDDEAGPSSTPVADEQKISATAGGLIGPLDDSDNLGQDVTGIGDLDGDGISDLAVGVPEDDDGGINRGAVYVLFMNADGTVRGEQKISDIAGGFAGALDDFDEFGHGLATLGDLDGDGVTDIAVGTWSDDDGGPARGAVWILFLERDGTVKGHRKISDTTGGLVAALDDDDVFGSSLTGPGDVDGDGTPDLAVGARWDDDGGTDNGATFILFLNPDGTVRAEQKISDSAGGLTGVLDDFDEFGHDVAGIGDLDGDGIGDLAVGVPRDDDGGADRGAVLVLLLNADGTVRAEQKLSANAGPLAAALDDDDWFGSAIAGVGDLDGNGTPDLAVGARGDGDGAWNAGAVHLIRLAADGTIVSADKISATTGGLTGPLEFFDHFGRGISSLGDLDGDGTLNLAISARYDDDGGTDRGAVYVLDLSTPTPSNVVTVNSTGVLSDQAPGDGVCSTGGTNSEGDLECTLLAALNEANDNATVDTVHFDIPTSDPNHSSGTWTITPPAMSTPLTVIAPVTIDATTQPGASVNTAVAPAPMNGRLAIELSGAADDVTADWDGLALTAGASGSVVRGISFVEWDNATSDAILAWGSSDNVIAGNYFGVRADGVTAGVGNMAGVGLGNGSSDNRVGGTAAADRNLFSAALAGSGSGWGLVWNGGPTSIGNVVQGNEMGFTIGGVAAPADANGVTAISGAISVGGLAPAAANRIRGGWNGVLVLDDYGPATVSVLGNRIWGQIDLSIDLEEDSVTPNDPLDVDAGPNALLNHPVITSVDEIDGTARVSFDLDVPAGTYRIEFFENVTANPNGSGPGEVLAHVSTVTHPGGGSRSYVAAFPASTGAPVVAATATEVTGPGQFGATSEFSSPRSTVAAGSPVVDHSPRRADLDALGGADGAAAAAGNTGSAVELAGGAQRLVAPTFDVTGSELSVSGWVRLDSVVGDPRLVSRTTGSTTILDVFVSGTTATARLRVGGSTLEVNGGSISLATWHQIAATWDGAILTLYVDGDPVDTAAGAGALATDVKAPLVVGNTETRDRGLDGRIDDVRIAHAARSADWIRIEYFNLTQPDQFVTLGVSQTAPPGTWTASTAAARTGTHSLAAPVTPAGADAWATVIGIDEPGLVIDAWWRLTDPGAARVATGTATGNVPVDQLETGITFGAVDLATQAGTTRTVDDTAAFGSAFSTWSRVELRTDELGRSTALVDGTVVVGPALHSGGPGRGSAGVRVAQLTIGQAYVDDVRIRRYVSDEPTATLGPLLRL